MSFNLAKLLREAMGAPSMRGRERAQWWDFEKILRDEEPSWNEWVAMDPSLVNVLTDVTIERGKKIGEAMYTYGLTREAASDMMKTFLGFSPGYGIYSCIVGPYLSHGERHGREHVHQGGVDRFGYYIRKHNTFNKSIMVKALGNIIAEYNQGFAAAGQTFDPSDFRLISKSPVELEMTGEKQRNRAPTVEANSLQWDDTNPDQSREANPQLASVLDRQQHMGLGSVLAPNANGYIKILNNMLGEWGQQALRETAESQGKTVEQVLDEARTDTTLTFIERIYKAAYRKWKDARDSGVAAAMGIQPPPTFKSPDLTYPATGQQTYTALKQNKEMIISFRLQQEVLRIMSEGVTDPHAIAERMNTSPERVHANTTLRRRGKEPILITGSDVSNIIDKIESKRASSPNEPEKTYQDVYAEIDRQIGEMVDTAEGETNRTKVRGFSDIKTAIEMAESYVSGNPFDPVTKSKLGNTSHVFTQATQDSENYTSDFLKAKRADEDTRSPLEARRDAFKRRLKEDKAERERLFGTSPEATEPQAPEVSADEVEAPVEEVTQESPPVSPPVTEEKPKEEANPEDLYLFDSDIVSSTVNNLIKIARDLDSSGKEKEAEEIHKVIRKYIRKG